ncbi:NAD(P)H-dependent oxidoreductase [Limosilactobacillus sp. STM2_1]|uniref:NAD(P)H-dependent oxidoreductase n=1 Tax=Limosilactobacillus rudii TaxID=2759755 RepID=A0A7W3ULM1_9LACO|nr:flavodoxin [Limosilactobacillus rudii]MBB1079226.1 NAD(P)H-dependent oxidoreductase [Limosilactobacillus rudii]MBB1097315.1 NAD(P)H-dependent oxidoreductase [Limosilactobacillus rudii]MCD7134424.1 NAD(P)H-dependent oxidoreductase [Limosilactobacillus rudii]
MANTLVLYYSATNTTKKIAEQIAEKLGADIAEIHAAQPYTAADLDWHDSSSRTSIEQHEHNSRVEIKDDLPDISGYDNIVIGHPIWWAIPPRMISSVIDHLNLNGKNLALFATSGGTNYARSQSYIERAIKQNNYDTNINQGAVLNNAQQIDAWIDTLNFA